MPLSKSGKCLIHDIDLKARNARVAQAFKKNHPAEFSLQRQRAGHNGFMATGERRGWEKANEKARQWRVEHPSPPERGIINVLTEQNINHYQREYPWGNGSALDFAWVSARYAIEAEGYRAGGFGDPVGRCAKQDAKVAQLEREGWVVFRYVPETTLLEQVVEFARMASAREEQNAELPF